MLQKWSLGVFAIIPGILDDQVLVSQRWDDNRWNLPGGGVEEGEDEDAALVRETREETGLIVKPVELVGTYTHRGVSTVAFFFWCDRLAGKLVDEVEGEVRANRFFPLLVIDEWTKRGMFVERQAKMIKYALQGRRGVHLGSGGRVIVPGIKLEK